MTLSFGPFEQNAGIAEQRKLFCQCFPEAINHSSETREFYNWKFHSFPDHPSSYEYGAWENTKLVGYYAALPLRYSIGAKQLVCGMVCDVMTSPSMRGKGVFTQLGRYSLLQLSNASVNFVLGYPIRKEVIPGHLKVGWKIAFDLPMYLFPLRTFHLLTAKKLGWLTPFGDLTALLWRTIFRLLNPRKINCEVKIQSIDELLSMSDFDTFIVSWKKITPNALNKTKEFLKWRLGAPKAKYFAISVRENQGQLNNIVLCRIINLNGIPSLAILDWMSISVSVEYHSVIRETLCQMAQQENVDVIVTMMSHYQYKYLNLWRQGFIRTPAVFKLIVKSLHDSKYLEELLDEKRWALMWIDSDDL